MNANDTVPNAPGPRSRRAVAELVPDPALLLRIIGEADEEVQQLRTEVEALRGALILLEDARDNETLRLQATLNVRTAKLCSVAAKLAAVARDACPILRRYLSYLLVGELPEEGESRTLTTQQVDTLLKLLEPIEQQK